MHDSFMLQRFRDAQEPVIDTVMAELRAGRKRSHWMWYVFPQLAVLGRSAIAKHYGIASLEEARAYLADPVLGPRLIACATCMLSIPGRSLATILGSPDDLKFASSMTLFSLADPAQPVFRACLDRYCDGKRDRLTTAFLESGAA
jgi:uncharacterized protein (DUF1810 family)